MPDINLLGDTKKSQDEKNKRPSFTEKVEMTRPLREEKKQKEEKPHLPFFKRFFPKKPKERKEEAAPFSVKPGREKIMPKNSEKVEDIFEEISSKPAKKEYFVSGEDKVLPSRPSPVPPINRPLKSPLKVVKEEKKEPSFMVNLLPEELVGHDEPRRKLINLSLIILGTAFFIFILYLVMVIYQSNIVTKTENVKQERINLEAEINGYNLQHQASIAVKEKIDAAKSILDTHIYWTKFFEKLEQYTVKNVYFPGDFSATVSGSIDLKGSAPDYQSVAEQLVVFQNATDFVKNVSITSATLSEATVSEGVPPGSSAQEQVSFSATLVLAPELFYRTDQEILPEEDSGSTNDNANANLNTNVNSNINFFFNLNSNVNTNSL